MLKRIMIIFLLSILSFSTAYAQQQQNEICFKDESSTDVYCFEKDKQFTFKVKTVFFDVVTQEFSVLPNMQIEQLYVRLPRKEPQTGAVIDKCVTDSTGTCEFKGYGLFLTGTFRVTQYNSYTIDPVGNSEFLSVQQKMFEANPELDAFLDDETYLYLANFRPSETYYLIFYQNQENTPSDWQWTMYSNADFDYGFSGFATFGSLPESLIGKSDIEKSDFKPFTGATPLWGVTPTPTIEIVTEEDNNSSNIGIFIFLAIILAIVITVVIIYYRIKKIDQKWRPEE